MAVAAGAPEVAAGRLEPGGPPPRGARPQVELRWRPDRPTPGQAVRLWVRLDPRWQAQDLRLDRLPVTLHSLSPGIWYGVGAVGRRELPGPRELLIRGLTHQGLPFQQAWTLQVDPRPARVERLRVAPERADPPAALRARLRAEEDCAGFPSVDVGGPLRLQLPLSGRVTSRFGAARVFNGRPGGYHLGVDLAGRTGDPVHAPGAGIVLGARDEYLGGRTLRIDHGHGWVSHLMHLHQATVRAGEVIDPGQPVATVGASGRVTGPHLHWALSWRGRYVDPMDLARTP